MTDKTDNKTLNHLLATLSLIIGYQGNEQLYHAWRVAIVAKYICDEINPKDAPWLFCAGLLHDVGITGIGNHPAQHPEIRNDDMSYWLRYHPIIGAKIVHKIPGSFNYRVFYATMIKKWRNYGYNRIQKK